VVFRFAILLAGLTSLAGCVSAEFRAVRVGTPIPASQLDGITVGDSLQSCLNRLGAPHRVQRDDEGLRTVLTWEWLATDGWGVSASVPVSDSSSASLDYGQDREKPRQIRLFFSKDMKLTNLSSDIGR